MILVDRCAAESDPEVPTLVLLDNGLDDTDDGIVLHLCYRLLFSG